MGGVGTWGGGGGQGSVSGPGGKGALGVLFGLGLGFGRVEAGLGMGGKKGEAGGGVGGKDAAPKPAHEGRHRRGGKYVYPADPLGLPLQRRFQGMAKLPLRGAATRSALFVSLFAGTFQSCTCAALTLP